MTLGEEASRSLHGAWGLLRRDPAAPTAFNATLDGFWRSFAAAVVLLPLYLAYLAYSEPAAGTEAAAPATRWALNFLVYVIGWALWPLIAVYLTRALGCGQRLVGYIVAYNWSQLLTAPFLIGVNVVARAWFPEGFATLVGLAGAGGVLLYEYLIARQMLTIPPGRAVVVVFASFALALTLHDTANFALKLTVPEAP